MPAPVERKGRAAAPGIVTGPLFRLDSTLAQRRPTGMPAREREALNAAMLRAIEQIAGLMSAAEGEAHDILEFQAAMLSDEALSAPALERIDAGDTAEAAWLAALSEQIATYESAADDYFRARGNDLIDLRDRVLRNLSGIDLAVPPPGAILFGLDVTPTRFLETDWSRGGGIALSGGSPASHVAMLARGRGVPMVVGLGALDLDGHQEAMVDGDAGAIVLSPGPAEHALAAAHRAGRSSDRFDRFLKKDARTANNLPVDVFVNLARPEEVDSLDVAICDGVGLMRTEFLFSGDALPDEETQYRAYRKVLDWAAGRPVTIRTVDAGGDKPVKGLTIEERNPFLGLRGIRLSLARPDVFRVQLRALARAAVAGNLKVMLPMVTVPAEIDAARAALAAAVDALAAEKLPSAMPALGIMVEVPAVALMPERYAAAEFLSIGSNDLTQYVTAAARDSHQVADLCDVTNPAVMRLIADVAGYGRRAGIEVSLCGDAAGDQALVPLLLKAGLRALSVQPAMVGAVKAAIARTRLDA